MLGGKLKAICVTIDVLQKEGRIFLDVLHVFVDAMTSREISLGFSLEFLRGNVINER